MGLGAGVYFNTTQPGEIGRFINPLFIFRMSRMSGHEYVGKTLDLDSELSRIVGYVLGEHNPSSFSTGEKVLVTSAHSVSPVLQCGPMCGLVGITMAGHLLQGRGSLVPENVLDPESKLHPENILVYAKREGLSKQGEIFSVDAMTKIVTDHLLWQTEVWDTESREWTLEKVVTEVLLGQSAVLLPYDADRNHSPCLAGGHRAHWCLLVGMCVVLDCTGSQQPTTLEILKHCHPSQGYSPHYTIRPEEFSHHLKVCFDQHHPLKNFLDSNLIYVFARQGKSSHLGLWSLRALIESNRNLQEVDPQRSNPLEYVIPDGGLSKGLKNKILLMKR